MRVAEAQLRIGAATHFVSDHECADARHVALKSQHLQIQHQLGVIRKLFRYSDAVSPCPAVPSTTAAPPPGFAARHCAPHRNIDRASPIAFSNQTASAASGPGIPGPGCCDSPSCGPPARQGRCCRRPAVRKPRGAGFPSAAVSSESLQDDGVVVDAAVGGFARAHHRYLQPDFQGWKLRVLAELLGRNLVHRHAAMNVRARSHLRVGGREIGAACAWMIAGDFEFELAGFVVCQSAEDHHAVFECRQAAPGQV